MTQLTFDHLARRTDPASSHEAIRRSVANGQRETHNQKVWWATTELGRGTYHEIAIKCGLQPIQTQRRLTDLRYKKLVTVDGAKVCDCCQHELQAWRVT